MLRRVRPREHVPDVDRLPSDRQDLVLAQVVGRPVQPGCRPARGELRRSRAGNEDVEGAAADHGAGVGLRSTRRVVVELAEGRDPVGEAVAVPDRRLLQSPELEQEIVEVRARTRRARGPEHLPLEHRLRGRPLLHDVRELVRQEASATRAPRRVLPLVEHDVGADRVRPRAYGPRRLPVRVDPDITEFLAKAGFHESPRLRVEGLSRAAPGRSVRPSPRCTCGVVAPKASCPTGSGAWDTASATRSASSLGGVSRLAHSVPRPDRGRESRPERIDFRPRRHAPRLRVERLTLSPGACGLARFGSERRPSPYRASTHARLPDTLGRIVALLESRDQRASEPARAYARTRAAVVPVDRAVSATRCRSACGR